MAYQLIIHGADSDASGNEIDISVVEALAGHAEITLDITHLNGFPTVEVESTEYMNKKVYSDVTARLGFEIKTQFKNMTDQVGGGAYPYSDLLAILKKKYHFLEFDGTYYDVVSDIATKALSVALMDFSAGYVGKGASQVTMKMQGREVL